MNLPTRLIASVTFLFSQFLPFAQDMNITNERKPVAFHEEKSGGDFYTYKKNLTVVQPIVAVHTNESSQKIAVQKEKEEESISPPKKKEVAAPIVRGESTSPVAPQVKVIPQLEQLFPEKEQFLDKILSLEEQFSMNSYEGNELLDNPYGFKEGSIPILISAPHSTEHLREGKVKSADIYTGSLAQLLGEITDAHVLVATKIADDPNYNKNGNYKDALEEIVSKYHIQYVIDLHGASSSQAFDIDLGTINGKSMNAEDVKKIKDAFVTNGLSEVTINGTFAAVTEGTITNYSFHKLHTNSIQIEINKKYRNPRNDLESYYDVLQSLVQVVKELQ